MGLGCRLVRPLRRIYSTQSATKTFENQSFIERLPIPSLSQTIKKYLKSVEPLLSAEELENTKRAAQEFEASGVGEKLQDALGEWDREQKDSWLEPIWLQLAYLGYRAPLPINSNWFVLFQDRPGSENMNSQRLPSSTFTAFQIQRASELVQGLLNYKELVDAEKIPAEYLRSKPLCMNQYRCQFGAHRTPNKPLDVLDTPFPATARHIVLLAKNQTYKVPVYRSDNSRLTNKELETLMMECVADANHSPNQKNIPILTAGHRDNWAEALEKLSKKPLNQEAHEAIRTALFAVCLDDRSSVGTPTACAGQFFHNYGGKNRWYDKAIQLIVSNNGRAGVNGEHTPCDAIIPATIFNGILEHEPIASPDVKKADDATVPEPMKICWDTSDVADLDEHIARAEEQAKAESENTQCLLVDFDVYGSRYIKEVAASSPDAFVQMALQLAWYRSQGHVTAVYESASTRLFRNGRTETLRSLSPESWAFVQSFDNDDVLYETKLELFRKAVSAHTGNTLECMQGRGIDRHLLGLYFMALKNNIDVSKIGLFSDKAYALSSQGFKLSTSQVSVTKARLRGGFGPVHPEGYGVNYSIYKDCLYFTVTAYRGAFPKVDPHRFVQHLERSLKEMMLLFPKRSEVWGKNFSSKLNEETKFEEGFEKMSKLSKEHLKKIEQSFKKK